MFMSLQNNSNVFLQTAERGKQRVARMFAGSGRSYPKYPRSPKVHFGQEDDCFSITHCVNSTRTKGKPLAFPFETYEIPVHPNILMM